MNCVRCCRFRKPDEQTLHSGCILKETLKLFVLLFPVWSVICIYRTRLPTLNCRQKNIHQNIHYSSYSNI